MSSVQFISSSVNCELNCSLKLCSEAYIRRKLVCLDAKLRSARRTTTRTSSAVSTKRRVTRRSTHRLRRSLRAGKASRPSVHGRNFVINGPHFSAQNALDLLISQKRVKLECQVNSNVVSSQNQIESPTSCSSFLASGAVSSSNTKQHKAKGAQLDESPSSNGYPQPFGAVLQVSFSLSEH